MTDKNSLLKELEQLGFTKNISKVYLALHQLGEAKGGEIVRKTGLHRHIVYVSLETLENKKLVAKNEVNGVARFKILNPERLMNEIREKEAAAANLIEQLKITHTVNIQEVVVHEGAEAMRKSKKILYERMTKNDTFYVIGISNQWFDVMGESVLDEIKAIQRKNGFHTKGIGSEIDENEQRYRRDVNGLIEYKIIPDVSSKTTGIEIWPDRVLISLYVEPFTSVEIVNPHIVKSYLDYFNLLWKQEVHLYSGWKEIQFLFTEEVFSHLGDMGYECVTATGYSPERAKDLENMFELHNERLLEKKVSKQIIFCERMRASFVKQLGELPQTAGKHIKARYLPDEFASPMETHVYPHLAVVSCFGAHPVSTVYHNKEIIEGFKKNFDLLWSIAKE